MKGGLNYWFSTIMKGTEPPATASSKDFDLYHFRLAARQYFTGGASADAGKVVPGTTGDKKSAEKVNVIKKTSKPAGGGC